MSMWAAIFGIVTVSCLAGVVSSYFKSRGQEMADGHRAGLEGRLDELSKSQDSLQERVRTLERIVTDGHYDLKKEFDELERG